MSPKLNKVVQRSLSKDERVKLGIDRDDSKFKHVPPMMEKYLKVPLSNADHPFNESLARKSAILSSLNPNQSQLGSSPRGHKRSHFGSELNGYSQHRLA